MSERTTTRNPRAHHGVPSTTPIMDAEAADKAHSISRDVIAAETEIRLAHHGEAKRMYAEALHRITVLMGELTSQNVEAR